VTVQPPGEVPPPIDQGYWNFDCRFIAFEAAIDSEKLEKSGYYREGVPNTTIGNLFLYDEVLKDVYILNAAIAGLDPWTYGKTVDGITDADDLNTLNPYAFADGRILFEFDGFIYYYDIYSEERVTVAFDGRKQKFGGAQPAVTGDGAAIAYINHQGLVVLKLLDGDFYTKTRVLTKIAAEAQFLGEEADEYGPDGVILDLDISDDGKWIVVNIDGILHLYDVANPHLFQLLPLSGGALAGNVDRIGHVAISFDGRFIAFTVAAEKYDLYHDTDERLLVLDRATGYIDTVPYANLGDMDSDDFIADPIFCGNQLLFETYVGGAWKVWKYDLDTELLRAMVILNNALGDVGVDVKVSDPILDP
jgi:WD40 repeat protein